MLLIESSGNMRSTVVFMLRQLGVSHIQAVGINDQVYDLLKEENYDIVLLGHNPSDPLTGMQILEECRYKKIIKPNTCWVFMTSDASQDVVLHVVESQPDAVITKPFSAAELKLRLDMLLYRKHALSAVEEAIQKGQLSQAVKLCDQVELSGANYDFVQLIKGRLLLQLNRFEEAEHFFKYRFARLNEKESGPCLAQAYIGQQRYSDAKSILVESIAKFPLLMTSYDLLAHVLEKTGELEGAQEALQAATQQSPLSLLRNMELGRIAVYNRNLSIADHAFKRSINLNKTSCYRSAEPYLKLANVRRLEMKEVDDRQQIALYNQVEELLNTAGFQYPHDEIFKVKSALLKSQTCTDLGDTERAEQHLQQANILAKNLDEPFDIKREMLEVVGDPLPILDTPTSPKPLPAASKKVAHKHDPEMSHKVNRLGVTHYNAAKIAQAIRYFGLAIEYDAKNSRALLNLAQLFLESARQQKEKREERLKMVQRYLRLTVRMELSDIEMQKRRLLERCLQEPIEKLPEGSLGVLLK
ncbi:response regulator [Neptunomonas phycophila]|uniref:response regulator n=1 Tax=Neptunomonas phycophila TaxID=1572645 RepID=UPI0026DA7B41|nr:tetratricopeptide repeat protein [Neptunomonas phycophila]